MAAIDPNAKLCMLSVESCLFPDGPPPGSEHGLICHWYATAGDVNDHTASESFTPPSAPGAAHRLCFCAFLRLDADAEAELQLTVADVEGNHLGVHFGKLHELAASEQFHVQEVLLKDVSGVVARCSVRGAAQARWTKPTAPKHERGTCRFETPATDAQAEHIWKFLFDGSAAKADVARGGASAKRGQASTTVGRAAPEADVRKDGSPVSPTFGSFAEDSRDSSHARSRASPSSSDRAAAAKESPPSVHSKKGSRGMRLSFSDEVRRSGSAEEQPPMWEEGEDDSDAESFEQRRGKPKKSKKPEEAIGVEGGGRQGGADHEASPSRGDPAGSEAVAGAPGSARSRRRGSIVVAKTLSIPSAMGRSASSGGAVTRVSSTGSAAGKRRSAGYRRASTSPPPPRETTPPPAARPRDDDGRGAAAPAASHARKRSFSRNARAPADPQQQEQPHRAAPAAAPASARHGDATVAAAPAAAARGSPQPQPEAPKQVEAARVPLRHRRQSSHETVAVVLDGGKSSEDDEDGARVGRLRSVDRVASLRRSFLALQSGEQRLSARSRRPADDEEEPCGESAGRQHRLATFPVARSSRRLSVDWDLSVGGAQAKEGGHRGTPSSSSSASAADLAVRAHDVAEQADVATAAARLVRRRPEAAPPTAAEPHRPHGGGRDASAHPPGWWSSAAAAHLQAKSQTQAAHGAGAPPAFARRRLYRVLTAGLGVRVCPDAGAARTGEVLRRGDVFEAAVVAPGVDGRVYLKPRGLRGWVFDDSTVDPEDPSVELLSAEEALARPTVGVGGATFWAAAAPEAEPGAAPPAAWPGAAAPRASRCAVHQVSRLSRSASCSDVAPWRAARGLVA